MRVSIPAIDPMSAVYAKKDFHAVMRSGDTFVLSVSPIKSTFRLKILMCLST